MDSQPPVKPRPSFFALDLHALGARSSEEVRDEIARSESAAAHVEAVEAGAAAVPGWVAELGERRRSRWTRAALAALATGAVTAAVLVFALGRGDRSGDDAGYTTIKGSADVAVFVKRSGRVFVWDQRESLRAGDAIRLQIAPAGFRLATVFADDGAALTELHRAPLAGDRPVLLEAAWTLDSSEGGDAIVVVLSDHPIDATTARAALDGLTSAHVWARRIRLRAAKELP